jgi:hypothetical protein
MKLRMKIISLSVPHYYRKMLRLISDKQGISIAKLVRNLIIEFVDYWISQNSTREEVL